MDKLDADTPYTVVTNTHKLSVYDLFVIVECRISYQNGVLECFITTCNRSFYHSYCLLLTQETPRTFLRTPLNIFHFPCHWLLAESLICPRLLYVFSIHLYICVCVCLLALCLKQTIESTPQNSWCSRAGIDVSG